MLNDDRYQSSQVIRDFQVYRSIQEIQGSRWLQAVQ